MRLVFQIGIQHCTKNEVFHWRFLQSIWPNLQFPADLVKLTEEILIGKLHFLCSAEFHTAIQSFMQGTLIYVKTQHNSLKFGHIRKKLPYSLTPCHQNVEFFLVESHWFHQCLGFPKPKQMPVCCRYEWGK